MKRAACSRAWEAEAVENRRMDGRTRASFERHATMCEVCSRERAALRRLTVIVASMSVLVATELERKRGRAALLREAHLCTVAEPRSGRGWQAAFVGLAVTVLAIGWAYRGARFDAGASGGVVSGRLVQVEPTGVADWSVDNEIAPTRMILRDGTVSLHVSKLDDSHRFVVSMPDGEIEVRGTRFVVVVRDSQTRRVDVTEGIVSLRLEGQAEIVLPAGETWNLTEAPAFVASADPLPRIPDAPAAGVRADVVHTARPRVPPVPSPSAGSLFASAMSAYDAGDLERAEVLLVEFAEHFPRDARCEDAAMIGIIIRDKHGDRSGARQRAHQYLAKYPGGLHQDEVERFLR